MTGNHEYFHGARSDGRDWLKWYPEHGVRVLNNTGLSLPASGDVGVGTRWPSCTCLMLCIYMTAIDRPLSDCRYRWREL